MFEKCLWLPAIAAYMVCAIGCERPTLAEISSGPSFSFSGSGRLAIFTVYAPQTGRRIAPAHRDVADIAWQVKASNGYFAGTRVQGMQLTYGRVPTGYDQTVPGSSDVPPLKAGLVYSFFAETTDAPGVGGYLYMSPNGLNRIDIPDLCLRLINGKEVETKCGTNEPYQEPADLDRFAREHPISR